MKREASPGPGRGLPRKAWIAVLAFGVLAVLYVGVLAVADRQLTRMLPGAVAQAVGGLDADRYVVSVGDVALSATLTGVSVEDLRVSLDPEAAASSEEPALVRAANLGSLRVTGLRMIPLLRGKGIFVSSVEIDGPEISLDFAAPVAGEPATADSEAAGTAGPEVAAPLNARLRRIRIRDGSIDVARPTDYGTLVSFLRDLDLELTEIQIDAVTLADPVRALTNSRVSLAFDSVRHVLEDSLYVVTAIDFRAESRDSILEIGRIQFTPTLEAMPFFGRLPQRADRMNLSAGPIRIQGLDFTNYVREEALNVRLIAVDSLDLHAYSDIELDWGPRARACRFHEGFGEIPFGLRIDTIRVNDGLIRYSELAKGSTRPGDLTLEHANAVLTNLTNDPELMTRATPAVVHLTAKLFGEANMDATVRYPLLSSSLDFDVEASAGPMSLATANRFASNVAGVEITSGDLDSIWVGMESRGGRATGRVHMRYRDLDFRVFDRNTGKAMVWHSVLGFAGGVATRASNPGKPGEVPRDGEIDYTCSESDIVFFEYFVKSLISGIRRIVLIV